ncbi:MAG: regulatory signaling modulator protein AmpE [Gammaproteobacteria bacterium]|nr:regulatory signaling modulator protein AmpE [Gammaproteobacteria bacterium]
MSFIIILVAIVIERFWTGRQRLCEMDLFGRYYLAVRQQFGESETYDGAVGVFCLLLPLMIFIGLLQQILSFDSVYLVSLFFGVVILLLCMGNNNLDHQLQRYLLASEKKDENELFEVSAEILKDAVPVDEAEREYKLIRTVLAHANDGLMAMLFWFFILGPMGAVLYRCTYVVKQYCEREKDTSDFSQSIQVLYGVLSWLPARITAYFYGFSGDYSASIRNRNQERRVDPGEWMNNNERIMVGSGLGALHLDEAGSSFPHDAVDKTRKLINRATIIFLSGIAILTFFGF